jgi:hypothetical protein
VSLLVEAFFIKKKGGTVRIPTALLRKENHAMVLKGRCYGNLFSCNSQATFSIRPDLSMAEA